MIPSIRSISELMVLTEFRDGPRNTKKESEIFTSMVDSAQRKRYIRSIDEKEIKLPDLPKILRSKWIHKKELVSKFIDNLDYNNQIQSSYDLTLLERQNNRDQQGAA